MYLAESTDRWLRESLVQSSSAPPSPGWWAGDPLPEVNSETGVRCTIEISGMSSSCFEISFAFAQRKIVV
jgi:hypothetical protein